MVLYVTPMIAAILAAIFLVLSFRVINQRGTSNVSLGDGGDEVLIKRLRVHGNFAEYAPFALLLLLIAELQGAQVWALYVSGVSLIIGRLCHAIGTGRISQITYLRVLGMLLTFVSIIGTTLMILKISLFG